jgi:DNA-binding transcriptional LysR family regulator
MAMNLNQLRVFHAVAKAGSVTRAAQQLRVSQPAISKQLAEFEEACGLRLVDRLPRGVRLTPAGQSLADYADRLFVVERTTEELLTTLRAGLSSRLRVGASTTIGSYLVPELFGALQRTWPKVELTLEIGNTAHIYDLVRQDRVDLGLTEGLSGASDLESSDFGEDEVIAIAAPGDPFARKAPLLEEFLARPWIGREPGSGTREVLEKELGLRHLRVRPALELGSTEAVKKAVALRLGVGFVSSLAVELELHAGRLARVDIRDFSLKRALHKIQLSERQLSPLALAFQNLLTSPPPRTRVMEYAI